MHSPWGMLMELSGGDPTKLEYLLEKVSWPNIQLMMADKVQMVKRSEIVVKVSKDELKKRREKFNNG